MASMNVGKVLVGGVAAGIVLNAVDYVSNNFILAKDWQNVAQLRNIDLAVMGGTRALVTGILVDVVLGLLLVFTYAAIRPRFGPGPGTATVASFIIFLATALVVATYGGVFFSWDVYIRSTSLTLVSVLAGGLAGAWVYNEEEETAVEA